MTYIDWQKKKEEFYELLSEDIKKIAKELHRLRKKKNLFI